MHLHRRVSWASTTSPKMTSSALALCGSRASGGGYQQVSPSLSPCCVPFLPSSTQKFLEAKRGYCGSPSGVRLSSASTVTAAFGTSAAGGLNGSSDVGARGDFGAGETEDDIDVDQVSNVEQLRCIIRRRDKTIAQLQRELADVRASSSSALAAASALKSSPAPPSSSSSQKKIQSGQPKFIAKDSSQLQKELQSGTNEIHLLPDTIYELPFGTALKLSEHSHCHVVGASDGSSQILGNFKVLSGANLHLESVFLVSTSEELPLVEVVGASSGATLTDATLTGGRDGVFLCNGGHCTATKCTFSGNVRGVFESFRCHFEGSECSFSENTFHMVLLRQPNDRLRVKGIYATAKHRFGHDAGEKGDIALAYNPVQDSYGDVFVKGSLTVLTASENTTHLVDPTS